MNKICKIGIGTAAAVGAACVTSFAVDKLRRKWFILIPCQHDEKLC